MSALNVTTDELLQLRYSAARLKLTAKTSVSSVIAGTHTSRFRGRGVDFLESRHYQIGDDIRNLDWRVTARTGKPHTKVFQEERERPIIVLLDLSPSMYFATQGRLKASLATRMAALVAWAAVKRGDRIGGIVLTNNEQHEMRPRGGRRGALRFINLLEKSHNSGLDIGGSSELPSFEQALGSLRRVARPGSLVLILSDFYRLDEPCHRHLAYLKQHNDVLAFQVLDSTEKHLLPDSIYPVSDGNNRSLLDLTARKQKKVLQDRITRLVSGSRQQLNRFGIPLIDVSTRADALDTLMRWFATGPAQR